MKIDFASFKNSLIGMISFLAIATPHLSHAQSVNTYIFTGSAEYFTVPAGVTSIFVTATGGAGGCDTLGGAGAEVCDTIQVAPGMMIQVNVGGEAVDTVGGFNGGGAGGNAALAANQACGGGGASDVRVPPYGLGDRILVAGGGGGKGGGSGTQSAGGDAECPDGANGANGFQNGGTGATTTSAGLGGSLWGAGVWGLDGSLGQGGNGVADTCFNMSPGGGGGGGWYGGGSGAADCFNGASSGGGGGGGSSYYSVNGCCTPGVGFGNGTVVISYSTASVGINNDLTQKTTVIVNDQMSIINIRGEGNFTFDVLGINGQVLISGSGFNNESVPVDQLETGLYLVRINQNGNNTVHKIKL